jgi:beta-lactamase superfamily II metal-dependent hydrolase
MSIVKSLSVGDGDMFYIKHNTDNFSLIDCCITDYNKKRVVDELIEQSRDKGVIRFISTHPDDDHIRGLEYLNTRMTIRNFYCVKNEATKEEETADFLKYCELRDSDKAFYLLKGCSRKWMNISDTERGQAGIQILWPGPNNEYFKDALQLAKEGESPNNISPIVKYSLKEGATVLWMGDLETDFMENIKDDLDLSKINILFAPHHGRISGTLPTELLQAMNPDIIIIGEADSENLNYYDDYNTITQNSAGDIILDCRANKVHIYVGSNSYSVDFLVDEDMNDFSNYIGTLNL